MAICLNKLNAAAQGCLLRKGPRVFALLGKATSCGLVPFTRRDVIGNWALTAEFGCLRLERLSGDEEVIGAQVFLPVPSAYDYGVTSSVGSPELVRLVFGLLPFELERLVNTLRQGSFPVLGFSLNDSRCSISAGVIPGSWPHVVISNMALHGNVVSLETFVRVLVSSLPQSRLGARFPELQPVFKRMMKMVVAHRPGIPYTKETLALAPSPAWLR